MSDAVIPELPLLLYPSVARAYGVEVALLLSVLQQRESLEKPAVDDRQTWRELESETLSQLFSFWTQQDLQRVLNQARERGLLLIASAPFPHDSKLKYTLRLSRSHITQSEFETPPREPSAPKGKHVISENWQPSQVTLDQLAQLNVPAEFARDQVPEFVAYWRERREAHRAWGQKFINRTMTRWRDFEAQQQRQASATAINTQWQPQAETVQNIADTGIPRQFVLDQIPEFVSYWQARGERQLAWDSKFIQRVQSQWADAEAQRNVARSAFKIFKGWRPSEDAVELMCDKSGIPREFVDDAIPEFIIYWSERGTESTTWNSLFIKHVRLQWHKYRHALSHNTAPQMIAANWQPHGDVFDILSLANIDSAFARALVPEFVLYWQERAALHGSWSTRFLQHVKWRWAQRHQLMPGASPDTARSTRDLSLDEELNDTRWANG